MCVVVRKAKRLRQIAAHSERTLRASHTVSLPSFHSASAARGFERYMRDVGDWVGALQTLLAAAVAGWLRARHSFLAFKLRISRLRFRSHSALIAPSRVPP
jgi:hypothetical protein